MRPSSLAQLLLNLCNSGIRLYDWQKRLLDDSSRFRAILKSRGVGVSYLLALEALTRCLTKPDTTIILISYSQRQSMELFRKVKQHLTGLEQLTVKHGSRRYRIHHHTSKMAAEFSNGSRIIALPNNPDTLRGYRADHVYVDEAGMFKDDFQLKTAVAFTTVARNGTVTLASTPKGSRGWFYDAWSSEQGWSKHRIHYSDAPHITAEELQGLRQVMTSLEWEQEMETVFLGEADALFPYDQILACVEDYQPSKPHDNTPTYLGVDFGRYRDSTVITGLAWEADGRLRICLLKELNRVDFNSQVREIEEAARLLQPRIIAVDKTGLGIPVSEALIERVKTVKPITITSALKESIITSLKNLIENKLLIIPADAVELINQLHLFQRKQTGSTVRYQAPSGEHDDYVISLALATHAALTDGKDRVEAVSFWRW